MLLEPPPNTAIPPTAPPTTSTALHLHPQVREALLANTPIVALESTILCHGLPYPTNLQLCHSLSETLRTHGALPATIAVLNGIPHVGLTPTQQAHLCRTGPQIPKLSTRDLPVALANRTDGATTVAATCAIAAAAGISVFATGGIGGVHRGVADSWDISADITALSTHPVLVVCAGAKSILDLPKTLQALETASIPVLVLAHPTFPAFYTRTTSPALPAPHVVPTATAAAAIFHAALTAPATRASPRGALLAVPIPSTHEADATLIQCATDTALEELHEHPPDRPAAATPLLLARVAALTAGASQRANVQLVLNNAREAARVSTALCALRARTLPSPTVLVVGGTALDVHCVPTAGVLRAAVSNRGRVRMAAGGVAKNVAEAAVRLGGARALAFVSAVGDDAAGIAVLARLREAAVPTEGVVVCEGVATGCFVGVMDGRGDLSVGVADMDDMFNNDALSIVQKSAQTIRKALQTAKIVCMDANLSVSDLRELVTMCTDAGVPCWFEPTSTAKCTRIVDAGVLHLVAYLSPNSGELEAIAERLLEKHASNGIENDNTSVHNDHPADSTLERYAKAILTVGGGGAKGQRIYCTRGARGVSTYCLSQQAGRQELQCRHFAAVKIDVAHIKSTTGAGDCFAGVCMSALARGESHNACIVDGIKAAAKCCMVEEAVPSAPPARM